MHDDIVVKMSEIDKNFASVKALNKVNFTLRKGEIHCLMGENGAGKSTLIKCLTGVYHKDGGVIEYEGKKINPLSVSDAMDAGISSVYQEINLCPNLTVAENIFIGRQPMKGPFIDWKKMNEMSKKALEKFSIELDVSRSLDSFSVAVQQMIAISRAVDVQAKVLIFDEPTSSLDNEEVEKLFSVMKKLKEDGMAIVFITHFLDQVYAVSDRITVLRNGELVGEYIAAELSRIELVTHMVGKDFDSITNLKQVEKRENNDVIIHADSISVSGSIDDVDLELKEGEVLGMAGLLGSGRTETAQALFGVDRLSSGKITLKGKEVKLNSPAAAIKHRIAFCPEDRKRDGIIGDLTIRENIILALQGRMGMFKFISRAKQNELADKYIKLLSIATPNAEKKVSELSGGNQQKVILARWLATEPEVLMLDEPTRGIDVGAKAEIMKLTLDLCREGMAVMFISSELEEVVKLSNKIIVMRDHKKIAELENDEMNQEAILTSIAGGEN